MLNVCSFIGRMSKDCELTFTQGDKAIGKFSIACQRDFKDKEGKYGVDFINCVSFGKTAEYIANYTNKGKLVAISGRLQLGNYKNKDDVKVYTTDIIVDKFQVLEWGDKPNDNSSDDDGFNTASDEDIPF